MAVYVVAEEGIVLTPVLGNVVGGGVLTVVWGGRQWLRSARKDSVFCLGSIFRFSCTPARSELTD